jgi:hypothetical protein
MYRFAQRLPSIFRFLRRKLLNLRALQRTALVLLCRSPLPSGSFCNSLQFSSAILRLLAEESENRRTGIVLLKSA